MTLQARLFDNDRLLNQAEAQILVTENINFDSANTVGSIQQLFAYKDYTIVKTKGPYVICDDEQQCY